MKPDERIEQLLNRFGQTISDLPKPVRGRWAYIYEGNEVGAALKWAGMSPDRYTDNTVISAPRFMCEYVRHLADVIDRMEAALETAANNFECFHCDKKDFEGAKCCDFRLDDEFLDDRISEKWQKEDYTEE